MLIKKTCRIDGLFSNDKNTGGVDLNIAPLIAHICIRDRLSEDGVLGFLMPDSIIKNKSFEGFRKMRLADGRRFYLNSVVRYNGKEKPFAPVTLPFAEYYFSFKKTKILCYEKKENKKYELVQNNSSFNNHFVIKNDVNINNFIGHNDLKFHSGVSLIKGGYYQLEFVRNINKNLAEFKYYETDGKKLRLTNNTIILEKEIVYPFIRADMIKNNIINETNLYCIFPYPMNSKEPYDIATLKNKYKHYYDFFMTDKIQNAINTSSDYNKRVQKTNTDLGIFRVGNWTYGSEFLITRDNTFPYFARVSYIKTAWGDKKLPIFDGHINLVSQNETGEYLQKSECDKLFDIFKRSEVQEYIKNSADSRSISSRLCNDIKI